MDTFLRVFYDILYSMLDFALSMTSFFNDFIYNTAFVGFSISDLFSLIPDELRSFVVFFLVELGFTTSLNIYISFLVIKVSLRLIPFIGKIF